MEKTYQQGVLEANELHKAHKELRAKLQLQSKPGTLVRFSVLFILRLHKSHNFCIVFFFVNFTFLFHNSFTFSLESSVVSWDRKVMKYILNALIFASLSETTTICQNQVKQAHWFCENA